MKNFIKNKKIYLVYTGLFIFIALIVFCMFIIKKRSFIWEADGIKQHYIILKNFNEMVKGFLANSTKGLDLFSWNMGLGSDVIGQYSYYILGDPFAYLSLLFPMKYLEFTYTFLILFRMFFIGIAFIYYGKYQKRNNKNILLGAIIYTFSAFSLFAGIRHPYFLNAMIIFPMLLTGIDKLFKEDKCVFLTIWIAISAILNYYFFYMHTIMLIIYAVIKYICEYRKQGLKLFWKKLRKAILIYIIGVLIAGIILLPTIYAFLNSSRSDEETICQYDTQYYRSIFSINLLTVNEKNWSCIGVSSIILLMLPVLWTRRKSHLTYLIYLIICSIILIIPFLGSVMNGFSFPNNRWSFIYSFILAYIVTLAFDEKYSKKEIKNMCIFLSIYTIGGIILLLYIKNKSSYILYLTQILITFLMLMNIWQQNNSEKETKSINFLESIFNKNEYIIITFALVILSIGVMAFGLYTSYSKNYVKEFISIGKVDEKISTQLGENKNYEQSIKNIQKQDNSFYRIAKLPHLLQNLSIYYGYPSTECFLSIGNKYVYNLNKELADNKYTTTNFIRGIGDRTKITTLLGVKYYIADKENKNIIPYGYTLKQENDGVQIYENKYQLSIGIAYSKYLLREEYEKLNPVEKEDALLKVAVIENEQDLKQLNIEKESNLENIKNCYNDIKYQVNDNDKILNENSVITAKDNQSIILNFPKVKNSELYVYISGFKFEGNAQHTISAKLDEVTINKIVENKLTSAYYQNDPEILLNLGYYEEISGDIELNFSKKGKYNFDKIQILAVPMNSYDKDISNLQKSEMQEVNCNNKEIKGKINVEQDSILQISTSYTIGWKAYVDGKKVETIQINTAFIGIPVSKGEHEVILRYEVPYLKTGIICSVLGLISLTTWIFIEKKNKRGTF